MNNGRVGADRTELLAFGDTLNAVAEQVRPHAGAVASAVEQLIASRSEYITLTTDHSSQLGWHVTNFVALAGRARRMAQALAAADDPAASTDITMFSGAVSSGAVSSGAVSSGAVSSGAVSPTSTPTVSTSSVVTRLDRALRSGDVEEIGRIITACGRVSTTRELTDFIARNMRGHTDLLGHVANASTGAATWSPHVQVAFLAAAQRLITDRTGSLQVVLRIADAYATSPGTAEILRKNGKFIKDVSAALRSSSTNPAAAAELAAARTPTLVLLVNAIVGSGNDTFLSDNDHRALAVLFESVRKSANGNPDRAYEFIEGVGAENVALILRNLRVFVASQRNWFSDGIEPMRNLLDDLDAIVAAATRSSRYGVDNPNNQVNRLILEGNVQDVALLLTGTSVFSSNVLAMIAARILLSPDSAATTLLGIETSQPYWCPRELVLDALETDLKKGGTAAETYLFGPHTGTVWGTGQQRINALLLTLPSSGANPASLWLPDADLGQRAGEVFLEAALRHWAIGTGAAKHDVVGILDTEIGSKQNGGRSTSEFGRFALAKLFSVILGDPSTSEKFEVLVNQPTSHWLFRSSYEQLRSFIGNIADSELGFPELMVGLATYLKAQGSNQLMTDVGSADAGKVTGVVLESIRTHFNDEEHAGAVLAEILLTTVILVGVAATGGWVATAVAAPASKVFVTGAVEFAKNIGKVIAKNAARESAGDPVEHSIGAVTVVFLVSLFSSMPAEVRAELQQDPDLKPFIRGNRIMIPTDDRYQAFVNALSRIALSNDGVRAAVQSFQTQVDNLFARHPS